MLEPFQFKGFQVAQGAVGLKVNSDAILLGAHVFQHIQTPTRLMDVGSGTGVISAMLATHPQIPKVTAVEIDATAAGVCQKTMAMHPNAARWNCLHTDATSLTLPKPVDWVVSNPPYFKDHPSDTARGKARQQHTLPLAQLLDCAWRNTPATGRFSLIYPASDFETLRSSLLLKSWYLQHVIWISDRSNQAPKRVIVSASKSFAKERWQRMYLFNEQGEASAEYGKLVEKWYTHIPKR